jgi:GH15 family glucan-1,4-alpha-glucosidase
VTYENDAFMIRRSVGAILRNQASNGAIVASPDFAQYHFCWLRDASFSAYALDRAGEQEASGRYHSWVNEAVEGIADIIDRVIEARLRGEVLDPMHMPPARFAIDGSTVVDDWPNFQIDGYGTWLWSLGQHLDAIGEATVPKNLLASVRRVARYLATFALSPCYDVWEENGDAIHTSTLACVYGGLQAAGHLLDEVEFLDCAETVRAQLSVSAARIGYYVKSSTDDDVDASSLWLSSPFGVINSTDESFSKTVTLIEDQLSLVEGIRRYPTDVYFGSGAWPVLTASLGWHHLSVDDVEGATRCRDSVAALFDDEGFLGEQFGGDRRDPKHYQEWVDRWGPPARDLTWSHAMFVVLSIALKEYDTSNRVGAVTSMSGDDESRENSRRTG